MRFQVRGANRNTGEDQVKDIEATDAKEAEAIANEEGMMVSRVIPISAPPPVVVHAPQSVPYAAAAIPHPQPHPHQPYAPTVIVRPDKIRGVSGFGIAALVMGILALLFCWIPFVGILCIPLAIIGCILALVGLIVSLAGGRSGVGLPVAGGVACLIAIVISVAMTGATANAIAAGVASMPPPGSPPRTPALGRRTAAAPTANAVTVPMGEVADFGNGMKVTIASARIGKVKLTEIGGPSESDEAYLALDIAVQNDSPTAKQDYSSWQASSAFDAMGSRAAVQDDLGNVYKRITFSFSTELTGAAKAVTSVYPGAAQADVLVFEKPVDAAKEIKVTLKGKNVGSNTDITFTIPADKITRDK